MSVSCLNCSQALNNGAFVFEGCTGIHPFHKRCIDIIKTCPVCSNDLKGKQIVFIPHKNLKQRIEQATQQNIVVSIPSHTHSEEPPTHSPSQSSVIPTNERNNSNDRLCACFIVLVMIGIIAAALIANSNRKGA